MLNHQAEVVAYISLALTLRTNDQFVPVNCVIAAYVISAWNEPDDDPAASVAKPEDKKSD